VQQKPADELAGRQCHRLGLALMTVILPGKSDLAVVQPGQPAVGDGNPMSIAAEIGKHLLGTGERTLGKDHPVDATQRVEAFSKRRRFGQRRKRTGEAQLAVGERWLC
jgi:hypothetical protein